MSEREGLGFRPDCFPVMLPHAISSQWYVHR